MMTPPDPEIPAAIADKPQAETMEPIDGEELRKRTTHEIGTDDMVMPSAL